ncbi:alpha-N-acetylneuraminide alpha-2,8-sialyltransferase-like [Ahaetulla prasina]|uniref:alpha-N-acetylneuraminide alpha-2,8-sialyltransferase-like n=1 Tax=Ahaetulla prasina TaxID=499056 RepID=UPI002647EB2A|nr:alpha-N-acetylneuraminide alpha-2,8-sialyltransferase-like [Ahaetulla prasina]
MFSSLCFDNSSKSQKPLFKKGKFPMEEVLRWQPMLIQQCPWKLNATAVMQYREELGQCCNASHLLVLTKENTPLRSIIHFDGDKHMNITVDANLRNMLLKRFPLAGTRYRKCAVVGNGGILQGSRCGQKIDQADFIIRFNLPPLKRTKDVGTKTHLVTINPSIFSNRFNDLVGPPAAFINVLRAYQNAFILIPALSFNYHLKVSYRAVNILKDFGQAHRVFFLHPRYLGALDKYWRQKGVTEIRLSTGFMFTSFALEFCDHITLYGFWPFLYDLSGKRINHHYFDNVLPHPLIHTMSEEFSRYLNMSDQGVLRIQLGKCQ